jgi:hypothetical protein
MVLYLRRENPAMHEESGAEVWSIWPLCIPFISALLSNTVNYVLPG